MAELIHREALQNYIDEMYAVSEKDIRNKAIEEFVDEMKKEIFFTVDVLRRIDEIAEQLKGE